MKKPEWLDGIWRPIEQCFNIYITPHLPGGWRTAALVNTILIIIVAVLMTIFSAVALVQAGGFERPLVFFTGACGITGASTINATLHVIINILSTAMLASSNMFMQILNAPSREEINKTHARGSWLEIGVLSSRNIFRLSPFKTIAWLGFFISSIPIHLLFNSTVFEASYKFSKYDLAIASESFIHGGKYHTPGASLLSSGRLPRYGDFVNLTEFKDNSSIINNEIATVARIGRSWERIDKNSCKQEYLSCSGLSSHSDVILVVADTDGWPRSQVWNFNDQQGLFWDTLIPDDAFEPEHNSLWFYGKCAMSADSGNGQTSCDNSCRWALGGSNATKDWVLPFYPFNLSADLVAASPATTIIDNEALKDFVDQSYITKSYITQPGSNQSYINQSYVDRFYMNQSSITYNSSIYNYAHNKLNIGYCLAQPVQEFCKVALSTTLLVCVTVCAIAKATICVWAYRRLRSQNPLATPGDAIDSFISEPDPHTVDLCLLISKRDIRLEFFCGTPQPGPREYQQRNRKLVSAISVSEGMFLCLIMMGALGLAISLIVVMAQGEVHGGFGTSSQNPLTASGTSLVIAVLIVNSPQLALSTSYVAYNNILTRLVIARGWALRSTKYSYLRVTNARGCQRSTYRLQLPYRFSIPLIVASAVIHWLMSNALYIFVSQGDYFQSLSDQQKYSDPNLPPGSTVSVGYSTVTVVILVCGLIAGFAVPAIWSQKHVHGLANSAGCISFAISASCHVSPLARPDQETSASPRLNSRIDLEDSMEALIAGASEFALLPLSDKLSSYTQGGKRLERVGQSKLRWGVVKMPAEWSSQYDGSYDEIGHISFGTIEDQVEEPRYNHWYA